MNLRKKQASKNMNLLSIVSFFSAAGLLLVGCYRMPTEEDYSVVPRTNHPDVIREKPMATTPSVEY
jgi:hypothetical protein